MKYHPRENENVVGREWNIPQGILKKVVGREWNITQEGMKKQWMGNEIVPQEEWKFSEQGMKRKKEMEWDRFHFTCLGISYHISLGVIQKPVQATA